MLSFLFEDPGSAFIATLCLFFVLLLCAKKKDQIQRDRSGARPDVPAEGAPPQDAAGTDGVDAAGYEETLPPLPSAVVDGAGSRANRPAPRTPTLSAQQGDKGSNQDNRESNYVQVQLKNQELTLDRLELERHDLEIIPGAKLGEGVSGEVHKATLRNVGMVAVKQLTDHSATNVKEFLEEATLMASFNHPNVVRIIGACIGEEPHMLVMEFLSNGDLVHFLHDKRAAKLSAEDVGLGTLLGFAADVAKGMAHLEHVGCVHRDLAARNVLLSENLVAKLTDFGLSRRATNEYYEQATARQLPVRWMAYETLTVGKSSIRSDVWSFGVLLWEIMTLGETPYTDLQGGREIVAFLDSGQRLGKPKGCPDAFYAVMYDCWLTDSHLRPAFTGLDRTLAGMKTSFDTTGSIAEHRGMAADVEESYWRQRSISREESEEILDRWGGEVGTFLIRESGAAFVISRVGRSDVANGSQQSVTMIIHRKIDYKAGMYQMQSTRTKAPAFKTLVRFTP